MKGMFNDITGQQYGSLTVISFIRCNPHSEWLCLCVCGKQRTVRATRLTNGLITSCVSCSKNLGYLRSGKTKELPSGIACARSLFGEYKVNARRKCISFTLTDSEFESLVLKNCHYCGVPPQREYKTKNKSRSLLVNGIDRKDSSIGYLPGNTVPCCHTCNYAKREMSCDEFLEWAKRICRHQSW